MFQPRFLTAEPVHQHGDRSCKPYHLNVDDRAIEPHVLAAAYEFLPRLFPAERDPTTPAASFVIVHRGRGAAVYLLAYSWVWDNVLECHTASAGVPLLGSPDDDPTHFAMITKPWIGCVWELAPFEHERAAWVRHMLIPDEADLPAYLADRYANGPAGGPDLRVR